MAKLSAFTRDRARMDAGERIQVGAGEDAFFLITKGLTSEYRDGLAIMRRQAAREANRHKAPGSPLFTAETLPPSLDDKCQADAIGRFCLQGVEGLVHDDDHPDRPGEPVTVAELRDMLHTQPVLLVLAISACQSVGLARDDQRQDAEGN